MSELPTPIPPMANLPTAQAHLQRHGNEARYTNPTAITDRDRAQRELPLVLSDPIANLRKSVHIDRATEQTLPKHDGEHDPDCGYEAEQGLQYQNGEVQALQ